MAIRKTEKKITKRYAIKLAKQYIDMCLLSGIDVSKVILFGSLVSGTADENSDIDLLIVSKKFKNNTLENWKIISPISALFYDVDPHPYPLDKFKKGDPFVNEVKQKGIEISID